MKSTSRAKPKKLPRWLREEFKNMVQVKGASTKDMLILVMGIAGVGKSNFVNIASRAFGGPELMKVGDELQCCTLTVQHVAVRHPTDSIRRIIFIDTPGLNGDLEEAKIIQLIAVWLSALYHEGTRIAGIIYMHDISQARISELPQLCFDRFKDLCGSDALRNVCLLTTKWGDIEPEAGEQRELRLRNESSWMEMINHGSAMYRFDNSEESARGIVTCILQREARQIRLSVRNGISKHGKHMLEINEGQALRFKSTRRRSASRLFSPKNKKQKGPIWRQESAGIAVEEPNDRDILIPVMGVIGAGKSTFINVAVAAFGGSEVMRVGHGLQSCTSTVQHVAIQHPSDPNRRIIFVDTPGFDDSVKDDAEILRLIAVWLARSYHDGMKCGGIIYMHEISQSRMHGGAQKCLTLFKNLCGENALKRVFITTTKWANVQAEVGSKNEQSCRQLYWREMIDQGSIICRFDNDEASARAIIELMLQKQEQEFLIQITNELVNLRKSIPETEAGRALRSSLSELLEQQKQVAQQLAGESGSTTASERLERVAEMKKGMQSTVQEIMKLKVPLSARITNFLGF